MSRSRSRSVHLSFDVYPRFSGRTLAATVATVPIVERITAPDYEAARKSAELKYGAGVFVVLAR